jgi:hypothetical protein
MAISMPIRQTSMRWPPSRFAIGDVGGIRDKSLQKAISDDSASVAIAACDGLLSADDKSVRAGVIDRLIDLANVEQVDHFAVIAALNVLDMNVDLDSQTRAKLADLPRQVRRPPARVGKYVSRLIEHATESK